MHEFDDSQLVPTFQPIISVSTGELFGYELLGRIRTKTGELKSLGPFFHDPAISEEEKLSVDRKLRELALSRFRETTDVLLFVNMRPYWISSSRAQSSHLLESLAKYEIEGSRIVIEITEADINERLEGLLPRIKTYREYGCRIAIDDFHFKDFDRLILFRPDIVKIHIDLVRKGARNQDYRKLLRHISSFSEQLGATTLFEGIEESAELELAISTGGSLLQGFYFAPAHEKCMEADHFPELVFSGIRSSLTKALSQEIHLQELFDSMNEWSRPLRNAIQSEGETWEDFLDRVLTTAPEACFRAYVCNSYGKQISENFERKTSSDFSIQTGHKNKNWSWRPYFPQSLQKIRLYRNGSLSEPYLDFHSKKKILTYSCPLGNSFLFCDLHYNLTETHATAMSAGR